MAYSGRAGDNLVLEEIVFSGAHFEYTAQHFNICCRWMCFLKKKGLPSWVRSRDLGINYYLFVTKMPTLYFMASKPPYNNAFSTYKIPLIQKALQTNFMPPPTECVALIISAWEQHAASVPKLFALWSLTL